MLKKVAGVLVSVAPLSAFAEVPAGVTTAISTGGADAVTVAGAVLAAIIGVYAVKLMRKGL